MDYGRVELAEKLAAEYALGVLRGGARRRFERLLPAHPGLADALAAWQQRLQPLAAPVTPVQPPARVWQALQYRLFGAPPRWWRRLGLWQGFAGGATAGVLALALLLMQPSPVQPPLVIVLNTTDAGAGILKAGFVASVSADGAALVLKPLGVLSLEQGRALELWAVPGRGAPRSLGLVSTAATTTVLRQQLLKGTAAFALSLEPAGGSPTGAPTGPIVSAGTI